METVDKKCFSKPKISIITITYNSEITLQRTIDTIKSQNYNNLEYIIVDGGSTDKTLEIIKSNERYVTKWISEPDKGIADAFNKGIKLATGDIVGIINSDDGLCNGALDALANSYEADIDIYRGNVVLWNTFTGTQIIEIPSMHFPFVGLTVNVSHQATFIKRDAYQKYGMFHVEYKYSMDLDLLMRMERCGAKFKYIDNSLAYFTMGGLTFSDYNATRRRETEQILKSHGAKWWHIWMFRIVKYTKIFLKKIINIDNLLRIKNRNRYSHMSKKADKKDSSNENFT